MSCAAGARYKYLEQLYLTRDGSNAPVRFAPAFGREVLAYECTVPFDTTTLVVSPFPERKIDAFNVTLKVAFSDAPRLPEPGRRERCAPGGLRSAIDDAVCLHYCITAAASALISACFIVQCICCCPIPGSDLSTLSWSCVFATRHLLVLCSTGFIRSSAYCGIDRPDSPAIHRGDINTAVPVRTHPQESIGGISTTSPASEKRGR